MKRIIKRISKLFKKSRWDVVEAYTSYWTLKTSEFHQIQKLVFYIIEFNTDTNEYRLRWEGEHGDKHSSYGSMLQRLADLNLGAKPGASDTEDFFSQLFNFDQKEETIIISVDLNKGKEYAFTMEREDEVLVQTITNFKKTLEADSETEVFEESNNILVTNKGYYIALYNKDVSIIPDENEENE